MKNWKVVIVLFFALLTTACAAPRFSGNSIPNELSIERPEVVLIENSKTRDGLKQAIEAWLKKNGYKYAVVSDDSKHDHEKISIEYVGFWRWDLALYLSAAEIEAFHQGQRVGKVSYKAPNSLNTKKFSNAEQRIHYMLEILFGKLTAAEASKEI